MLDVHTALPGEVRSYDFATQTADIRPMVLRAVRDDLGEKVLEQLPVLPKVPVLFPRSSQFFVAFPLAVGDTGLLVFSERSIDTWRATGRPSDPGDQRQHGLSGAVFLPGVFRSTSPIADAHATRMVLGEDGEEASQIHLQPNGDGILLGGNAVDFLVQGTSLAAAWAVISGVLTAVPPATTLPTVITLAEACRTAILGMISDLSSNLSTTTRTD